MAAASSLFSGGHIASGPQKNRSALCIVNDAPNHSGASAALDRDALFREHIPWAERIARNLARRLPSSFDVADLEQEARIEHWKQCGRFDPKRGVPYQGAAYLAVQGAVLMFVRRRNWTAAVMMDELKDTALHVDSRPQPDEQLQLDKEATAASRLLERRLEWATRAIFGLDPELRDVACSVYLEGVDPADLAVSLGTTKTLINRKLRRAVGQLKRLEPSRMAGLMVQETGEPLRRPRYFQQTTSTPLRPPLRVAHGLAGR